MHILLTDAVINIGGTAYSGQGTSVAISMSAETYDIGVFGVASKSRFAGATDWAIEMEFVADEAVTGAFFAMVGTSVAVKVRATSAAISATNPSYEGNMIVTAYNPLGSGEWGSVVTVAISGLGDGVLERKTTP
jgi:hypothetical protein